MTPLPKKKHTRSRSNRRRHGQKATMQGLPNLIKCTSCGKLRFPHTVCPRCGSGYQTK